jgi:cytochrome c nitrite reductase small subunit
VPSRRSSRALAFAVACALGVVGGAGAFTFAYGKGLSYFGTEPSSCANCHVMEQPYDDWLKSSHHAVAGCADCHLPPSGAAKWISKADNGFFHSLVFTLGTPDAIQIKPRNRRIVQDNCIRCHRAAIDATLPFTHGGEAPDCVACHGSVGHGAR